MTYDVIVSEDVWRSMDIIVDHIVSVSEPHEVRGRVERLLSEVEYLLDTLSEMPDRGSLKYRDGMGRPYRTLFTKDYRYALLYRVNEDRGMVVVYSIVSTKEEREGIYNIDVLDG